MKIILAIATVYAFFACSSNNNFDVVGKSENYLQAQMKDPSSFQVIKSEIVDTIMLREFLQRQYEYDTAKVSVIKTENELSLYKQGFEKGEEAEKAKFEKILSEKLAVYQSTADRHLNALNNLKQDSIYSITTRIEYRAKNGFGALDKYSKLVDYFPSSNSFKTK